MHYLSNIMNFCVGLPFTGVPYPGLPRRLEGGGVETSWSSYVGLAV